MTKRADLPKVIIFYGPLGSGKNTQAELLNIIFPNFTILDYGSELRNFIQINNNLISDDGDIARNIQEQMTNGSLVSVENLMHIISNKITKTIDSGKSVFLIGPGRMLDETTWLANHLGSNNIPCCILHLHLSLEDIVERLAHRYFAPHSEIPYSSYKEALLHCQDGQTPLRRADDQDPERVVKRYRSQYKNKFSSILFTFQLLADSRVFLIDAAQPIETVNQDIVKILNRYYQVEV